MSVHEWQQYVPSLIKYMKDQGLWEDRWGGEPAEVETRSQAGDHYYIRPAGSQVNTLPGDHPFQLGGDPDHWEVEHHHPEIADDPEGSFGDIYGPTALNKNAIPVDGVHPHGFSSLQHAMDWVQSRHPEEGFDPDDTQDPFDPRLIGAGLRRVGFDWKPEPDYTDDMETVNAHITRLENGHEMRVGRWPDRDDGSHRWWWQIYTHAPDYNLGGHFGSGQSTREEAQSAAENQYRQKYPLGTDTGGHKSPMGDSGLDYENLINPRDDLGDEDYGHIFGMLRQAGWNMADIIRLAGDGMSWEDTMAHIDQVLAEGEPEDKSDYSTDYSVNHYDEVDIEGDRLAEQAWRNQEEDNLNDRLWDEWMGQLSGKHHRWLEEVDPKAMDHDFAAYRDHRVNGASYTMTPVPQDELHRQQRTIHEFYQGVDDPWSTH